MTRRRRILKLYITSLHRLTALDLIAYLAAEDNPKQWLHMHESEMELILSNIRESNLKLTLAFGIGIHHAGLHERDRNTVEELFINQKIQVRKRRLQESYTLIRLSNENQTCKVILGLLDTFLESCKLCKPLAIFWLQQKYFLMHLSSNTEGANGAIAPTQSTS